MKKSELRQIIKEEIKKIGEFSLDSAELEIKDANTNSGKTFKLGVGADGTYDVYGDVVNDEWSHIPKKLIIQIREEIKKIIKEIDDDDFQKPKSIHTAIGPKQERGVIEGDGVKNNVDKILAIVKKHDPNNKMEFYPKTGKIVGAVMTFKLKHINKDLQSLNKNIKLILKPQKF